MTNDDDEVYNCDKCSRLMEIEDFGGHCSSCGKDLCTECLGTPNSRGECKHCQEGICPTCNGSGEGMAPGTFCTACGGKG